MPRSAASAGERGAGRLIADDARAALAWAARPEHPPAEAPALARRFGLLLYRDGTIREAQERMEQAAALTADAALASADLARAAAIAKCRVSGTEALRLELAAARRATGTTSDRARALGRAAELLNRFPGMFAEPSAPIRGRPGPAGRPLAAGDPRTAAVIAVATASYAAASAHPRWPARRPHSDAARCRAGRASWRAAPWTR